MSATAGVWGQAWVDADDSTLLEHVRAGDSEAYAELWRRHLPAAYGVAHRYRGRASAEDIVGEASLRVYDLIRAGKGPTSNFRSYFLTSVKTVAVDLARTDLRVVPSETEDLEVASDAVQAYDPGARVDQQLVRHAFRRLPERDQRVLWHTAVEGTSPAVVASTMGMTANGVSVAALRARDTLRARYLDAHADRAIERADDEECRWVLSQLGRYVRGKLPVRQRARVERHLQDCSHAQGVLLELAEVNRGLPALMVPLIFVAGSASAAAWVGAAAAGANGSNQAQEPTSVALAGNAAGFVAKAAALVAAGALGIGFVAAPSGGLDWFSQGGAAQTQAAGDGGGSGSGGAVGGGGSGPGAPGPAGATSAATTSAGETTPSLTEAAAGGAALAAGSGSGGGSSSGARSTTPRSGATPAVPIPPPQVPPPIAPGTGSSSSSSGSAGSSSSSSSSSTSSSSKTTTTTTTTTSTTSTTTTTTTTTTPPVGAPTLDAPRRVINGVPFLVRFNTGGARGGTLTASISSGTIWVAGCKGQPAAASVSCVVSGRNGTRLMLPMVSSAATLTITLTNTAGDQSTVTVRVRRW